MSITISVVIETGQGFNLLIHLCIAALLEMCHSSPIMLIAKMGPLRIHLEWAAESVCVCVCVKGLWQNNLWMIPIIIHNFFPLAAELLAGVVLFTCLFDACCIILCNPQCPSHTNSHIITPSFPFYSLFFFLYLVCTFSFPGFVLEFLPFCFRLLSMDSWQ